MRYDRERMRTTLLIGALVLAASAATGDAKPARLERIEVDDTPPDPCATGKTWAAVTTCLAGSGLVSDVYSTADVHVLHVQTPAPANRIGRVLVYRQNGAAGWNRVTAYLPTGSSSELLGVEPFDTPMGSGVQIQIGQTLRPMVSLDGVVARTFGLVKQQQTAICVAGAASCSVMITRCATYIDGRAYWSFDMQPVWHATLGVRLRGSTQTTGGPCVVSPSMIVDGDAP